MAVERLASNTEPLAFLPYLQNFGLPGMALALLAWVIVRVTPHIKDGIVQDRKNRREHELPMRKLEDQRRERERQKLL
jgi:hypothetical protein